MGGLGYGGVELLWRGRTHWSMLVAGGLCFWLFCRIAVTKRNLPLLYRVVLCALGVTAVEMAFGSVLNLWLHQNVWDYSAVPLNVLGQVCLPYTVLWGFLSLGVLPVAYAMGQRLFLPRENWPYPIDKEEIR